MDEATAPEAMHLRVQGLWGPALWGPAGRLSLAGQGGIAAAFGEWGGARRRR
jgi:hypothetical protein